MVERDVRCTVCTACTMCTVCTVLAWHARARPTPCRLVAPLPREGRLFGSVRVYDPAGPQNLRCPLKSHPNTYRSIRGTVQNYGAPCHAQRPKLPFLRSLLPLPTSPCCAPLCTSTFKFPVDVFFFFIELSRTRIDPEYERYVHTYEYSYLPTRVNFMKLLVPLRKRSFFQKFQNESKQFYSISEIKPRMVKPPS